MFLFSIGCATEKPQDLFNQNQQRWIAQDIRDYRYQLQVLCFCPPDITKPVIIEVRNAEPVAVTDVTSGAPVDTDYFDNYNTINKMFATIQDAFDRDAYKVTVSYHQLGYPTNIYIDFIQLAADDEITYIISNFQPL